MTLAVAITFLKSFWSANGIYILTVLFASSESLASMPKIKANSICQLILSIVNVISKPKV